MRAGRERVRGRRAVNAVGSSACSGNAEFEVGLWKACGIENRLQNFFEQRRGGGFDQESDLSFKWLSSNQLGNSRGINTQLYGGLPKSARF